MDEIGNDESANLYIYVRNNPSNAGNRSVQSILDRLSDFGNHSLIQAEAGPLPSDLGFGRDHNECLSPSGPEPTNDDPKELIEPI